MWCNAFGVLVSLPLNACRTSRSIVSTPMMSRMTRSLCHLWRHSPWLQKMLSNVAEACWSYEIQQWVCLLVFRVSSSQSLQESSNMWKWSNISTHDLWWQVCKSSVEAVFNTIGTCFRLTALMEVTCSNSVVSMTVKYVESWPAHQSHQSFLFFSALCSGCQNPSLCKRIAFSWDTTDVSPCGFVWTAFVPGSYSTQWDLLSSEWSRSSPNRHKKELCMDLDVYRRWSNWQCVNKRMNFK